MMPATEVAGINLFRFIKFAAAYVINIYALNKRPYRGYYIRPEPCYETREAAKRNGQYRDTRLLVCVEDGARRKMRTFEDVSFCVMCERDICGSL